MHCIITITFAVLVSAGVDDHSKQSTIIDSSVNHFPSVTDGGTGSAPVGKSVR